MINLTERFASNLESIQSVVNGNQVTVWTAMPGIVQSFDAGAVTATVQVAIKAVSEGEDGSLSSAPITILTDVPVVFPRGGGYSLTFPIASGDECLLVFASRCIDAWWQSGGVQEPISARMHDLSDAFCQVGPQSQANKISGISTSHVQLRSDDGNNFVEIDKTGGIVRVKSTTEIVLDTPLLSVPQGVIQAGSMDLNGGAWTMTGTINVTGSIHATGTITGDADVTSETISLREHVHTSEAPGSPTSVPIP